MRKLILISALALGTTAAQADNGFWYVGAGVVSNSVTDINFPHAYGLPDLKNTSWKAYGGVRPLKWLAGELEYIDLGSGSNTEDGPSVPLHIDGEAVAAYAVGFLPIPLPVLDVFGKLGLARWQLNAKVPFGRDYQSLSPNGTEFAWGVGVQVHISVVGLRLEYEGFDVQNSSGARVASLSVFLNF